MMRPGRTAALAEGAVRTQSGDRQKCVKMRRGLGRALRICPYVRAPCDPTCVRGLHPA